MPVGRWCSSTQLATLLTFWPPAPEERTNCSSMSCSRTPRACMRSSSCFSLPDDIGKRAMAKSPFVLDLEFIGAQRVVDPLDMLGAGGFEDQFDLGLADGHLAEAAAMIDL